MSGCVIEVEGEADTRVTAAVKGILGGGDHRSTAPGREGVGSLRLHCYCYYYVIGVMKSWCESSTMISFNLRAHLCV